MEEFYCGINLDDEDDSNLFEAKSETKSPLNSFSFSPSRSDEIIFKIDPDEKFEIKGDIDDEKSIWKSGDDQKANVLSEFLVETNFKSDSFDFTQSDTKTSNFDRILDRLGSRLGVNDRTPSGSIREKKPVRKPVKKRSQTPLLEVDMSSDFESLTKQLNLSEKIFVNDEKWVKRDIKFGSDDSEVKKDEVFSCTDLPVFDFNFKQDPQDSNDKDNFDFVKKKKFLEVTVDEIKFDSGDSKEERGFNLVDGMPQTEKKQGSIGSMSNSNSRSFGSGRFMTKKELEKKVDVPLIQKEKEDIFQDFFSGFQNEESPLLSENFDFDMFEEDPFSFQRVEKDFVVEELLPSKSLVDFMNGNPLVKISHTNVLASHLLSYFNSKEYSDINIEFEGRKEVVYAHKFILFSRSTRFVEIFTEDIKTHIVSKEIEPKIFMECLKYLYGNELKINKGNAQSLLDCAIEYQIHSLIEICLDCTIDGLSVDRLVELLVSSRKFKFDAKCLIDHIIKYFETRVDLLFTNRKFMNVDESTVVKLCQNDKLCISETDLWGFVMDWAESQMNHDESKKLSDILKNIIQYIRLPLMGEAFITMIDRESEIGDLWTEDELKEAILFCQGKLNMRDCDSTKFKSRGVHMIPRFGSTILSSFQSKHL